MITVENLRKEYHGVVAVEDSTFAVDAGEVFGIIGPNGAGKTTTLKMLAGLVDPTRGTARVAGHDVADPEMRRHVGFLPEESPLYEEMTPLSYLRFFADLYGVDRETARERIHGALDDLDLNVRDRPIGDLSKGMTRKVAIARSLVNDPDVLIYDEPASGLDPVTTNYVLEFVRDLAAEGRTVLFSAHNLYHVEDVCDRIVIMNRGDVVARGTVEEIRRDYGRTEYRVYTSVEVEGSVAVDGRYHRIVDDVAGVDRVREAAAGRGGEVLDIRTVEPSLEDVFLSVADDSPADPAEAGGRDGSAERDPPTPEGREP